VWATYAAAFANCSTELGCVTALDRRVAQAYHAVACWTIWKRSSLRRGRSLALLVPVLAASGILEQKGAHTVTVDVPQMGA